MPPVATKSSQDDGRFCFQSRIWDKLVPHVVELTKVYRQEDKKFIKAINECLEGNVSLETTHFMHQLSKSTEERAVTLVASRRKARMINSDKLRAHKGESKTYLAHDEKHATKRQLNTVNAVKHLHLKVGAPVILTRNINSVLVNGCMGVVVELLAKTVRVRFLASNIVEEIEPKEFKLEDDQHRDLLVRTQLPLSLAWAITIHKSQVNKPNKSIVTNII